jgi:hypothetical protein
LYPVPGSPLHRNPPLAEIKRKIETIASVLLGCSATNSRYTVHNFGE